MFELFSRNLTPEEEDAVAAFMQRVAVLPDAQRAPLPDPTVAALPLRVQNEKLPRAAAPRKAPPPLLIAVFLARRQFSNVTAADRGPFTSTPPPFLPVFERNEHCLTEPEP